MVIPTFQKGAQLAASDLNLAMDSVRRARVLPGVGIKLTETVNGTVVSLKPQRLAGGGVTTDLKPWQMIELTGEGEPDAQGKYSNYSFRVHPGTINNILPANTFAGDGLVKFTIQADGIKYLILDVATDGTKVTTATLKVESTLPTDAPPVGDGIAPSKIVIPLGIIQNNSPIALRSSVLTASPVVAGSKPKAPTSPNDEPFLRLWMWKVEGK